MEYKALTLYEGNTAIPQKHILRCYRKLEPLYVSYKGQTMTIPHIRLKKWLYLSKPEQDQFGRKPYKLAYYKFVPDSRPTPADEYKKYFG